MAPGPALERPRLYVANERDFQRTCVAMNARIHVLPDVLEPDLDIVFCGTAAGTVSAAEGAYYAHPQNRFWRALHAAGLTPRRLAPAEYRSTPGFGVGLTDIAKAVSGMDRELPKDALGREACEALRSRIERFAPRFLAFTSLTAGRRFLARAADFGEQSERIGQTRIWLLPSPSPTANWNWDESWWLRLGEAVRAARAYAPSRQHPGTM